MESLQDRSCLRRFCVSVHDRKPTSIPFRHTILQRTNYDAELRLPSLHCGPRVVRQLCNVGWLKESFQLAAAGSTSVFRPLNAAKDLAFWLLP
ncbi:uncharacterized protein CIMG_06816 [Coccidioides immitis RS]|uniref:Uncharacterized protein n=1 Tax=Coccidioides immitis (strain RS) TaxID=246410 RepID=J3K8Z8_COCIM|nr:uncharacterized protein CIMG_06816 [Coccidioides immitis RS]EAS31337.3 hypothetical protein CIMG_06816 [Coccidioides immitis RS]